MRRASTGAVYGLVAPGYAMAEVVADRLLGGDGRRSPAPTLSTKLKLLGVDVASFGDAHGRDRRARSRSSLNDPVAGVYAKLVVSDDAQTLLGGILVGDASPYAAAAADGRRRRCPADPLALIAPAGARRAAPAVDALPDAAQICSCNDVTKGDICGAIADGGCTDVAGAQGVHQGRHRLRLAACRLLKTAARRGRASSSRKALCEHFDAQPRRSCSRSSRRTGIRTFAELIDRARQRAAAATSASRRSPRSWPRSATSTSSTASRPRCRTPTTTSWPTCSTTAPTRSCRASPAARSPPRS